jgi:hypothetical protein
MNTQDQIDLDLLCRIVFTIAMRHQSSVCSGTAWLTINDEKTEDGRLIWSDVIRNEDGTYTWPDTPIRELTDEQNTMFYTRLFNFFEANAEVVLST